MDFGSIVGQLLQQGVGGQTSNRLEHALGEGGLGGLLGQLQGASGSGQAGGLGGMLGGLLGGQGAQAGQSGGLGGMLGGLLGGGNAQAGGIGALAGALLGGGGGAVKGALGGSAMAVLGSLAISALKNWQVSQAGAAQPGQGLAESAGAAPISEAEMQQMVAPKTAELCLKGMIAAAKSDGQIQDDEMQRIVGKLDEGGVTEEERRFVLEEMRKPLDLAGLVSEIPNPQIGAQVYASALMAISIDTESEKMFLNQLARGVGLDQGTVARLHQMVGAPVIS